LSGKIMTDSRQIPCWPYPRCTKLTVTEAGKEIRVPTTMDLLISHSWHNRAQTAKSPLMNWLLRNGPKWRIGVRCSSRVRTLAGLFLEKPIPSV
jgi:hypothetical protein